MDVNGTQAPSTPDAVKVTGLNFKYGEREVLTDVSFSLESGARCVLVGGNGAGKSTLLRVLGGKHMAKENAVLILGKDGFKDTSLNFERQHMDPNWGLRTVAFAGTGVAYQADIPVSGMMKSLQEQYPDRRDELLELLGIDPEWRMHKVSDGQRRRVQMFLGLLRPFKVLLLDEVTAVLDLTCRQDLLLYLRKETETRGATIVYATHIFDGLDDWATHVVQLTTVPTGTIGYFGSLDNLPLFHRLREEGDPSPLMRTVETWLRDEQKQRRALATAQKAEGNKGRNVTAKEEEAGENALSEQNQLTKSGYNAGGHAPGRLLATVTRDGGGFERGRMYNYW